MMDPELHLYVERTRSAELRREAAAWRLTMTPRPPRPPLRQRLGWTLVEAGLRLVAESPS
ncbi:MAG: hypothetical protein HOY71_00915 [Nonomuraea sp.]|nr:hypothetical protein [Nonomuraea sp.]